MKSPLFGCALLAVVVLWSSGGLADESPVIVRDRARIQEHLSGVEAYLRAQDTSRLSEAQRAMRAETIDRLHAYWVAGVFPHNNVAAHPTPIFVDDGGRPCAVGYLMLEAGYQDAVAEITATQNLEYVETIESAGLLSWLREAGISAREAAWIQPGYGPGECAIDCECEPSPVCGADGRTYANACLAASCFEGVEFEPGCCQGAGEILWTGDLAGQPGNGPPLLCLDDPNESFADLCTTFVEPPLDETSSDSCSASRSSGAETWVGVVLLGLAVSCLRRRAVC